MAVWLHLVCLAPDMPDRWSFADVGIAGAIAAGIASAMIAIAVIIVVAITSAIAIVIVVTIATVITITTNFLLAEQKGTSQILWIC